MTRARFVRDFQAPADPWPIVDRWASDQRYVRVGQAEARTYRKGAGFAVGARMLRIGFDGGRGHLEAWVAANGLARLFSFFILPREITIEPGGMKAALPRKMGQREIDALLGALDQPPVGASAVAVSAWTAPPVARSFATSGVVLPAPGPGSPSSLPPAPLPGPPAATYGPHEPAWSLEVGAPERRRAPWRVPVALALLLVAAGITTWRIVAAPSVADRNASAARGEAYETPRALFDALRAGGVPCTAFVRGEETPGALGSLISRSADCVIRGSDVSMTVFSRGPAMKELLSTWVTTYLEGMQQFGGSSLVLVGPNWTVTSTDEEALFQIQDAIGGKLRE